MPSLLAYEPTVHVKDALQTLLRVNEGGCFEWACYELKWIRLEPPGKFYYKETSSGKCLSLIPQQAKVYYL